MKAQFLLAFVIVFAPLRAYAASPFVGEWSVSNQKCLAKGGECKDRDIPDAITITHVGDHLQTRYRSKSGFELVCTSTVESQEGYELLISGCPGSPLSDTQFSLIHRIKIRGGALQGMSLTKEPVISWSATK